MRSISLYATVLVGCGLLLCTAWVPACGSSGNGSGPDGGNVTDGGGGDGTLGRDTGTGTFGDGGGPPPPVEGGVPCPTGLTCNVACADGGTTTISGTVYDPAGKNPLYNVAVYVPAMPLAPLPPGVPTAADACSCAALFKSGALANTVTGTDGKFTLTNVPVGSSVPLVIQIGKWRRAFKVNVTACQDNPQMDKSLALPGSIPAGDTDDNMPDIAVSTGFADTLECLMLRMGLPASEYVPGTATGGHVHVFNGGTVDGGPGWIGMPEMNPMAGAPPSSTALWSSQTQLMPFDILLLSCEGGETFDANPAVLEQYLNAGGRAFASHYHYAWFGGPILTSSAQSYTAPADWGSNLAMWSPAIGGNIGSNGPIGGIVDTTLNGSGGPFPKGLALQAWLTNVGALGQDGVPAGELSIYYPRYNALVGASNTPSQPWITSDPSGQSGATMYFSFDTPVNAPPGPDGGPPNYCGRAVFSDLHVGGNPATADTTPPPTGCDNVDLSPQEKALEFMLFDLSSCVIPDTVAPPDGGIPIK